MGLVRRLTRWAGLATDSASAHVEKLEGRQLLFSISVTADDIDPATGIGTVRDYVAYAAHPLIVTDRLPNPIPTPTSRSESFDNENYGIVNSGRFFANSGLEIRTSIVPASDLAVVGNPQTQDNRARSIRANLDQNTENIRFRFFEPPAAGAQPRLSALQSAEFTFTGDPRSTADASGLDTNQVRIELRFRDQLVATLRGAAIRALFVNGDPLVGRGTLVLSDTVNGNTFDEVRIESEGTFSLPGTSAFGIDDVVARLPPELGLAALNAKLRFGFVVILTGPVGSTATFTDLYGDDMISSLSGGLDNNLNGIPDNNNGIGRVDFTGVTPQTSFTMWGGTIQEATTLNPDDEFIENGYAFKLYTDAAGAFGDFERAGAGYAFTVDLSGNRTVTGLPPAGGSILVGSPYVRDRTSGILYVNGNVFQGTYNVFGDAINNDFIVRGGFNRPDQGFFARGSQSLGSLSLPGVLTGSSIFEGSVDNISVGYLLGSVSIAGDLGRLHVASDAGVWGLDPNFTFIGDVNDNFGTFKTNSILQVGRTVGEIAIAGRSLLDVSVAGDLESPITKPARASFDFYEREYSQSVDNTATKLSTLRTNLYTLTQYGNRSNAGLIRNFGEQIVFGDTFLRNDTISSAEFLGTPGTGIRIFGDLSGSDPYLGEDRADVYAFAADGDREIVIQSVQARSSRGPYYRILDQYGRTLAAPEGFRDTQDPSDPRQFITSTLRFMPTEGAGVYYLVVGDNVNDQPEGVAAFAYTFVLTGMAPTALGAYRTGGGSGVSPQNGTTVSSNAVNVLAGNIGSIRVGVGFADMDGMDKEPDAVYNRQRNVSLENSMSFQGGTFTTAGNLYNITAGGDIGVPRPGTIAGRVDIRINGNFGSLVTGINPVIGIDRSSGDAITPSEGDLNDFVMDVGGTVGQLLISGGIGMDQDIPGRRTVVGSTVQIRTGRNGGRGDIGKIRVGWHVVGDTLRLETSPGSQIGQLLISQDAYTDANTLSGIYGGGRGVRGIPITTGVNSDVRFVDFPQLDYISSADSRIDLFGGVAADFIDDSGARFSITVNGAAPGQFVGSVRALGIDGSQGVVVAQINVDLTNGRTLSIQSLTPTPGARVSIGRIVATSDATSNIVIGGLGEVDVLRIDALGGLNNLSNATTGGDIVAVDAATLNTADVKGNLGKTQMPISGPRSAGIDLGIDGSGPVMEVRGQMGFITDAGFIAVGFGGEVYRPINDDAFDPANLYLDDIGSFLDGLLEGMIVRAGDVQSVTVAGAMGDLILQGGTSTLVNARIDSDNTASFQGFDGLFATVYAANILALDVGDGIAAPLNRTPIGTVGVFAADDIVSVIARDATVSRPTVMGGVIHASNNVNDPVFNEVQGVNLVRMKGAAVRDARVDTGSIDSWWNSVEFGEGQIIGGSTGTIDFAGSTVFRSAFVTNNIVTMDLGTGVFDASTISITGNLGSLRARRFINSTNTGDTANFAPARVFVSGNIDRITATEDMSDLVIDAIGEVTGGISARDMNRGSIDIDRTLNGLAVTNAMRGTRVTTGDLRSFTVGDTITTSTFRVSGRLEGMMVTNRIVNTDIAVTGPDGSIGMISAPNGVSGVISSTGPISLIAALMGDIRVKVTTTRDDGDVTAITAGRDVDVTGDVAGSVGMITAGRHIGNKDTTGALIVRRDITSVSAPAGVLYNDLRSGGTIGMIMLGGATAKPEKDLTGHGSIVAFQGITTATITGDVGGDILSYGGGIGMLTITNGSLLPGRTIAAYDGSITALTITNGNLLGNVHADVDITALKVTGSGAFGNVGIDRNSSPFIEADARRNQLPVGVQPDLGFQSALISAGRNVVSVMVSNNFIESGVFAGQSIQSVTIGQWVANNSDFGRKGSFFAAGDEVVSLTAQGMADAYVLAGVFNLGADNRAGGIGVNADSVKPGVVRKVTSRDGAYGVTVAAGVDAGANGVYGDNALTFGDEGADDSVALGSSSVQTLAIGGTTSNTQVVSDSLSASVEANTNLVKRSLGNVKGFTLDSGLGTPGTLIAGTQSFTVGSATWTITLAGGGEAFFDAGTRRVTLRNTGSASALTVGSSTDRLESLSIVSNDDASLGTLRLEDTLTLSSNIVIDAGIGMIAAVGLEGAGVTISAGSIVSAGAAPTDGSAASSTTGGIASAAFSGPVTGSSIFTSGGLNTLTATAGFAGNVQSLSLGTVTVTGTLGGLLSSERTISGVTAGDFSRLRVRAGDSITALTASRLSEVVIAAGNAVTTVTVTGDVFDSAISTGTDLGRDGAFGGSGLNADTLSTGSVGMVLIGGNFRESDITAGALRGADGFFGTIDDRLASGRSAITSVSIGGQGVGSTRASESYRILATGGVGSVTINGNEASGSVGNFAVDRTRPAPLASVLSDVRVSTNSLTYTANLVFNQPMDSASLQNGMTVSEVREGGNVLIRLVFGADYTLNYLSATNTLQVIFSRNVTSKSLPQVAGKPGPGVYRFAFDSAVASASLQGARFDADGDGLTSATEDFSADAFVGDAGDKLVATTVALTNGRAADFYAPSDLDVVLDNNFTPDGLPDINKQYVLRGTVGDHPDVDTNFFRFSGDLDVYKVTLQAGQILRLTALDGAALLAAVAVFDANAIGTGAIFTSTNSLLSLPTPQADPFDTSFASEFLIKRTGTYFITVGDVTNLTNAGIANNPDAIPGGVGEYQLGLTISDDGDSGFTSQTNSGDGRLVVNAPAPAEFAGVDGVFGTPDDSASLERSGYTFTLNRATNTVTGDDGHGVTSTRDTNGRLTSTIDSALGATNRAGVPSVIESDVDIFHLNNREPIAPGTKMRVTVQLSLLGGDLGSQSVPSSLTENRGAVQLALFDTTDSLTVDDADLVFSPSEFRPSGGEPNKTIADNGSTKYGYDQNGDFFIEFVTPERLGAAAGDAGTFALYIQGVTASNYTLSVVTEGTGTNVKRTQNIFLELGGGSVDWLQSGGQSTTVLPFDSKTLGFTGTVQDGAALKPVQTYIVDRLIANLSALYRGAGLDVRFSTNPADFEFQPFSTVYLSSSNDPNSPIYDTFLGFNILNLGFGQFANSFNTIQPFGLSQRSDPLNASLEDESVVFVPSFALLNLAASRTDVDNFTTSLTGAVGRRVGEMMGLRITSDQDATIGSFTGFDPFASNSVTDRPGAGQTYQLLDFSRPLSNAADSIQSTDFFLGQQRAFSLLNRTVARR